MQPLLLAAGFALLIAISVSTIWVVRQSADASQWVTHTLTVQDQFSNLLLGVRRAESGQRGYLYTDDPEYLEDFRVTKPEASKILAQLRTLTADNPQRQRTLDQISELMTSKFDEMDRTIELKASGKNEEARALVLRGVGRETMNRMRILVEDAIADEGQLLTERTIQLQRNNQFLLVATLVGTALILLVGGLVVFLVQRTVRQRERALNELAATNANLDRIVAYRTADLTEANEEIQRFAYIVTHDLRSPLVNIMGFTSELEQVRIDIFEQIEKLREQLAAINPPSDAETQTTGESRPEVALGEDFDEAVGFIKTSISRMDGLINAVLKLSREGRREFHPEDIDMADMLNSISRTVAHRASEQKAAIVIANLPPLRSDRMAIEQIFSNLIDNALKYSRSGVPGRVEIKGHATPADVVYEVRDNGRGIDPNDHQRVFELFRRSGAQDLPGEGIGLAHVRGLVRRLGGHIKLTSQPGTGSTFTLTLPRQWTQENRSAA